MQQATVNSHCMYPSCPEGHQHTACCLAHLCSHSSQIRSFHCTCHLERCSVLRTVEWDCLLNLEYILITLTWLPVTLGDKIRRKLYTDLLVVCNLIMFIVKNIVMHVREFVRLWLTVYWSGNCYCVNIGVKKLTAIIT
jgi:hypothetical protein